MPILYSMSLLMTWLINAVTLIAATYVVPGFHVASFTTALVAAIVIGLINIFIKPLLVFITLPINLLTLGLFTFVINGVVLWLATQFVSGLTVDSAMSAILAALVISIVSTILSNIAKDLKIG
ncbi:MAG: phage holin family protein [Candidatus Daviesbacteria bacterium]|nr:phage holin family protein [Candidatus Daviesbacteria bacterium]